MIETLDQHSIARLCASINGGSGDDLAFSDLFDQIKEARRADAEYLTQGEWLTEVKASDWDQTIELASAGLAEQSKDLLLAAWLTEGLAHKHKFAGVAFGLRLVEQLVKDFWTSLYPSLEDGIEIRTTRLAWFNGALADIVGALPITQGEGYSLSRYLESKRVENLARQDQGSMEIALTEGKINAEIFQRSVTATDTDHLQQCAREVEECSDGCRRLQATLDRLMEQEAPSLTDLEGKCTQTKLLIERLLNERGIESTFKAKTFPTVDAAQEAPAAIPLHYPEMASTTPHSRQAAFSMLADAANFFRQTEPHSPVPYLVERAIKWGDMPLELWLTDVIKDDAVVSGIQHTLGTKSIRDLTTE
jgi:type VI secretion system protein ImpA